MVSQGSATGYVDLQVNGYAGVDFNDPQTSQVDLIKAAQAMVDDGVTLALPTVITGPLESMCRCLENLTIVMKEDEVAASVFAGVHIEGPFLSPVKGYIGAHPVENALREDLSALEQLCEVAGERTKIVTLAPEIDPNGAMTHFCVERGIRVAAGHTDAGLHHLEKCIDHGLSLFTHLGNGCPRLMDRHDNIIYRALRFTDQLHYSLIADGFHVPEILFRSLLDWIPHQRIFVVSDAISAAGLGPGTYQLGSRMVTIGEDKACRDASGEHFVGAASTMHDADGWLTNQLHLEPELRRALLKTGPMQWLVGRQS